MPADIRRIEDAAYGLRWLELVRGLHLDLRRSLVPPLPLGLMGDGPSGASEAAGHAPD